MTVSFSIRSRRFILMSASEAQPVTRERMAQEGCECYCAAIEMGTSARERASMQREFEPTRVPLMRYHRRCCRCKGRAPG